MLEKIDLNKKISKDDYKKIYEDFNIKVGVLQRLAKELGLPVILVFEGLDGAGKGTSINNLILSLDPRLFQVFSTLPPNEEEKLRPFLWRFWKKTPAKGRMAVFDKSWYNSIITKRVKKKISKNECSLAYEDIEAFERQLADGGTVIIKFFLHISKKEQKKRFDQISSNPSTAWRITSKDWKHHKLYDKYIQAIDEMIEKTDFDFAPWTIVESTNEKFAIVKIMQTYINTIEARIEKVQAQVQSKGPASVTSPVMDNIHSSILATVDLTLSLTKEEYEMRVKGYQQRLREIEHEIYIKRIPLMILYEGWDAAGKGGNIKRITQNMDPRGYEVMSISAPNDIEKAHHYLWRFWNFIPKAGHVTIFDRTWYGRVLVERVEGFCSVEDWKRSYREINEMEAHLTNFGAIVIKFWLAIDKDEQLRRFKERQEISYKNWKITEEDWRNREKWDLYKDAVDEMLYRTSTTYAPWTIVESNSKYFARLKTMETIIQAAEKRL